MLFRQLIKNKPVNVEEPLNAGGIVSLCVVWFLDLVGFVCLFDFITAISYWEICFETAETINLYQIFHIASAMEMVDCVEEICCGAETTFRV